MREFFLNLDGNKFIMFGTMHFIMIGITLVFAFLIYHFRTKLRGFKYKQEIAYVLAGILLLNMIINNVSKIALGIWSLDADLPLHFCYVAGYLLIYIIFTKNVKLYQVVYFFTFVGPLPSIIWTDLTFSFDRYIFYLFIISHHLMILTSLYVLFVLEYRVNKKYIWIAFVSGNLYVAIVSIFNFIYYTNYIMIQELPKEIQRIYPFVKYAPPILWLELVGLFALLISYIPAYILNHEKIETKT